VGVETFGVVTDLSKGVLRDEEIEGQVSQGRLKREGYQAVMMAIPRISVVCQEGFHGFGILSVVCSVLGVVSSLGGGTFRCR